MSYTPPDLLSGSPSNPPSNNASGGDPFNPGSTHDPFNPGWAQENPPVNPDFASQEDIAVTSATPPVSPEYYQNQPASSEANSNTPSHSAYYQPSQPSEAEEIARKKAEAEAKQGRKGVGGAAAIVGVAGLVALGPLAGVAAAGGAAYIAATRKGPVGSALRAGGTATSTVGTRALKFNQKHQVVQKTAKGIGTGVGWVAGKFNGARKANNPSS